MNEGWIKYEDYEDDGFIYLSTETLEVFGEQSFKKASTITVWLEILLRANEDSVVWLIAKEFNIDALKVLVKERFIDVYRHPSRLHNHKILVVVRPTPYTDVGTTEIPNLPLHSLYYGDSKRREPGYAEFRKKVLNRDGYKCCECGCVDNLEVHHIKEYVNYPELRTKVSNGITLCNSCHKKRHKKAVRRNGNI